MLLVCVLGQEEPFYMLQGLFHVVANASCVYDDGM